MANVNNYYLNLFWSNYHERGNPNYEIINQVKIKILRNARTQLKKIQKTVNINTLLEKELTELFNISDQEIIKKIDDQEIKNAENLKAVINSLTAMDILGNRDLSKN